MYDHINERNRHNKQVRLNRRRVVRKQKICLLSALVVLTLLISLTIGSRITFAKAGGNNIKRVKYYRSVLIQCGDSLDGLADRMCSTDWNDTYAFMHEISMINHLDEDEELIAGNYLTVPYYVDVSVE